MADKRENTRHPQSTKIAEYQFFEPYQLGITITLDELDPEEKSFVFDCTVKKESFHWTAGCTSIDLYTQGFSKKDAKKLFQEALFAWIESCLERNTLFSALDEINSKTGTDC